MLNAFNLVLSTNSKHLLFFLR